MFMFMFMLFHGLSDLANWLPDLYLIIFVLIDGWLLLTEHIVYLFWKVA